jgi:predicted dinucleotide-binding enzyme
MTQTIGFIGSGSISSQLARLATAAGLNVVLSNSRGPETLAELVSELGPPSSSGFSARRGTRRGPSGGQHTFRQVPAASG